MRDMLNFVRGAVADRDMVTPVLTRFCFYSGRLQGSNGRIAIDAPCEDPAIAKIEALVPADRFIAAVEACDLEPKIVMSESGRLSISRKPFRALLPTTPIDQFPRAQPTKGKKQRVPDLLPMLDALRPFIGEDSTRPWCLCIFADGERAYATNSNMIASCPAKGIDLQLPVFLIDELLRLKIDPDHFMMDATSITFFYGESWLRSQLITDEWPVKTAKELLAWKKKQPALPDDLVAAIESILPFCPDPKLPIIHFTDCGISTDPGETQAEIEGAAWPAISFDARNLLPMLHASTRFGIDADAGRGLFEGEEGFRGVMAGRKAK